MTIYKQFAKDVGIMGGTELVIAMRDLFLIPIIAYPLGMTGYGLWTQVIVTLKLTAPIASLVLSYAFIRFFAGEKNREKIREGFYSIFVTILVWSAFIGLIIFFIAPPLAKIIFSTPEAIGIVKLTAILIPLFNINVLFLFYFRTFRQMKTYSILMIIQNLGEVCLIFIFVFMGGGIIGAVSSLLIVSVLMDAIMLGMIISQIGIKFPKLNRIKSYLRYSVPLIPSYLSRWITNSSDRYIIAIFLGINSVGIYSVAYRIGSIIFRFIKPINFVLVPALSKYYDEGKNDEVKNLMDYSLKFLLVLIIPSAFGLSILAKPILRIMTQSELVSLGSLIVPFVALSMVFFCIYEVIWQVMSLVKRTKIIGIIWIITSLLNLCLNLIAVPLIGILGAALSTLIAFTGVTVVSALYSRKWIKFRVDWVFVLKSIGASIVMSFFIFWLNPIESWGVILSIVIGLGVYGIVLLLFSSFTKEEIQFAKNLIRMK